jgi:tRNA A22 N-methylase
MIANMDKPTIIFSKKRIPFLSLLASEKANILWDLCCDHGLIGENFLKITNPFNSEVYFVEQIAHLTQQLSLKIDPQFSFTILTQDACKVNYFFNKNSQEPWAFVIAGVGGNETFKIVHHILENSQSFTDQVSHDSEFTFSLILSPHDRYFEFKHELATLLRQTSSQYGLCNENEFWLWEKKQLYHMWVLDFKFMPHKLVNSNLNNEFTLNPIVNKDLLLDLKDRFPLGFQRLVKRISLKNTYDLEKRDLYYQLFSEINSLL